MFSEDWVSKKHGRDDDDLPTSGFSEHRTKRRIATLPHRTSPKAIRQAVNQTLQPPPSPTITPADSPNVEPTSFFSACAPSTGPKITPTSPSLDVMNSGVFNSTQSAQISDMSLYSEDMDMADSVHLSSGPFHSDPSTSISGRIPTPIHGSFAPYFSSENMTHKDSDFADDEENMTDIFRRARRLPSPISEDETSPSKLAEGLGDMQMEYEPSVQEANKRTPTKKGHTRSKHSLRSWTGSGELGGAGAKRTFSMGYRSDCEKCRNRVPGHFNHIITYSDYRVEL